ncbi:RluA family pseudouridine synthase [Neotamlana laminarinivorans]|uniref:RNA pseudouridine synthase n=1 Tax=Neotamlana laminarinivorans TaxID=2883124 RepID=A0A9X1L3K6_9FLAO|nr:RluA family pseudouridine synthase [Tamlana laminarinivorans]MCB4797366.1 RNA pseudouridine synthase [Tamlana laminarinivorans]
MPEFNFQEAYFHNLQSTAFSLPQKFTYPFYYTPHKLSVLAAQHLQNYLSKANLNHNFGLCPDSKGLIIGKMFGVMVVKNNDNTLGYLAAFSGKLANTNNLPGFVPTVFDTLNPNGFYKKGEQELNEINKQIEILEASNEYVVAKRNLELSLSLYNEELRALKETIKQKKIARKKLRISEADKLSNEDYNIFLETLKNESIQYNLKLKHFKKFHESNIDDLKQKWNNLKHKIDLLKDLRQTKSAALQKQIHQQYKFLNALGETKDLLDIFKDTTLRVPPAGAGECAAPKLFQYAYENNLKPIAMAEFWWGASPKSEVRKHKQFYPSCRSKCEPILGHMMQGLTVEDNPILEVKKHNEPLEILYEDDYLLLVNKPAEFLSVPGKTSLQSVQTKMQEYLPNNKVLLVHRLDMSTSGILLVAKNERTHKKLQKQFINRSVKKRYVAILNGEIDTQEGEIELPLRVDLDNRPQQLVCFQYGKPAKTKYKVVAVKNGKTRIHFFPITGRTHQLRVHAAHSSGLNTPIFGDDLYGLKANRLHLHAEFLSFEHPVKKKELNIFCKAPF